MRTNIGLSWGLGLLSRSSEAIIGGLLKPRLDFKHRRRYGWSTVDVGRRGELGMEPLLRLPHLLYKRPLQFNPTTSVRGVTDWNLLSYCTWD
ncbi:hypothetical protein VTK56DRAFT_9508 [Thermocarpiscus australiensis]